MKSRSISSNPDEIETVVSFNCRVETGQKIKVVLLGVNEKNQHYDFFDATEAVPLDEKHILEIKARHHVQGHYRKLLKGKGL